MLAQHMEPQTTETKINYMKSLYQMYVSAFICGMMGTMPVGGISLDEIWTIAFGYSDGQRTRGKTSEGGDGDWMPKGFAAFKRYYDTAMRGIDGGDEGDED